MEMDVDSRISHTGPCPLKRWVFSILMECRHSMHDQGNGGCEKWNIQEQNVGGLMVLCSTTFERI